MSSTSLKTVQNDCADFLRVTSGSGFIGSENILFFDHIVGERAGIRTLQAFSYRLKVNCKM
jgi:hypothetical protein